MQFLEPVLQHGAVFLFEHILPDVDDVVRIDADDEAVSKGVELTT